MRRPARRSARVVAVLLAVIVTAGSITLIVRGNRHSTPAAAPLPSATFAVSGSAAPRSGEIVPPSSGSVPGYDGANRVFVASLGVDARIVDEPTDSAGVLAIPSDVHIVGRWTGGAPITAHIGTVLLAGHVNYIGQGEGALYRLAQVRPGMIIVTTTAAGTRISWRVTALQVVQKAALPSSLFAPTGPRVLKVVTCGGPLEKETDSAGHTYNSYRDNVIVTAVPVSAR